jgi:stress response protein YsnF
MIVSYVDRNNGNSTSNILIEEVISLLSERLKVDYTRHKIGEIVVRKEIETQILQVQVPIRHEKLIVEQVSPEYKQLFEC